MNFKFFGNSLDLFKYDIINLVNCKLIYVAMLTEPESKKKDPKYNLYEIGAKNIILLNYIKEINKENLPVKNIEHFFKQNFKNESSFFFKNSDNKYFSHKEREEYFYNIKINLNSEKKSMIFLDPDVGIDIGVNRRVRSNRQMYIFKKEIDLLQNSTSNNSFISFFQHLGNHRLSIDNRIKLYKKEFGEYVLIIAYERILASIVFIFKNQEQYKNHQQILIKYIDNYKESPHFEKLKLV